MGWRKVDNVGLDIGRRSRGITGSDRWAFDCIRFVHMVLLGGSRE